MTESVFDVKIAAENALIIYARSGDIHKRNQQIGVLAELLMAQNKPWILDILPAYDSVLITYDVYAVDHFLVNRWLKTLIHSVSASSATGKDAQSVQGKIIDVPVWYAPNIEHDLARVSQHNNIEIEQVIALHQSLHYRVFCLGFAPGFAFMGEVDERIATPRLDSPRKRVPQGAVAIADRQTAIYPNQSPGGWNIIGLCPLSLFDPKRAPYAPYKAGDFVRFSPIDEAKYHKLKASGK
ncbi:5-oxoprolinase subunit PxpB [Aliiglaciecola sp. LCG003]|uniref:5-oxoprolinase subunit PxpB n=1 Tax=Aliiglaciecola sp. LCG003 TaxID=3053655 RepID=UPI0025730239|nr:5-oxoprolinase subunit PxpB [Aliiglaciecola sp. LCG003]WJG11048.1 5-oxoprolinase subunit PxpB [Aliiglaciecola sp. LCG003]